MIARMTPAADADTERRAGKQRADKRIVERTLPTGSGSKSQTAGQNKQAPHAVYDTRDCRQQLNSDTQRAF